MTRGMVFGVLSLTLLSTFSGAALAAPCGPAVLSKVNGKVLVNRGVGFIDGAAGMPLAVGDHVMLRGGTAEILFVNGTGSALSGAKSLPITACSADGSRLTSPALATEATLSPQGLFDTSRVVVTEGRVDVSNISGNTRSATQAGPGFRPDPLPTGMATLPAVAAPAIGAALLIAIEVIAKNDEPSSTVVAVQPLSR